jgi:hypothetical protein
MRPLTSWNRLTLFLWWTTNNPKLGGRSPKEMVEIGKLKKLKTHILEEFESKPTIKLK